MSFARGGRCARSCNTRGRRRRCACSTRALFLLLCERVKARAGGPARSLHVGVERPAVRVHGRERERNAASASARPFLGRGRAAVLVTQRSFRPLRQAVRERSIQKKLPLGVALHARTAKMTFACRRGGGGAAPASGRRGRARRQRVRPAAAGCGGAGPRAGVRGGMRSIAHDALMRRTCAAAASVDMLELAQRPFGGPPRSQGTGASCPGGARDAEQGFRPGRHAFCAHDRGTSGCRSAAGWRICARPRDLAKSSIAALLAFLLQF